MKREELKVIDLLCDMGIDVNGQRNLQPWKAYDVDEVNLVINELDAENERLKAELKQSATKCNKLRCLALHAMSQYYGYKSLFSSRKKTHRIKYEQFSYKFYEAYRKTKKALMEGK